MDAKRTVPASGKTGVSVIDHYLVIGYIALDLVKCILFFGARAGNNRRKEEDGTSKLRGGYCGDDLSGSLVKCLIRQMW